MNTKEKRFLRCGCRKASWQYFLENTVQWQLHRDIQTETTHSPTEVLNLLRILQEATQNMLKHSKATEFNVNISSHTVFKMEIQDNGIGFSKMDNLSEHYGLFNMKKRAEDVGGKLEIQSQSGVTLKLYL